MRIQMSVASKIVALVDAVKGDPKAFDGMRPVDRRHLADLLRYVAGLAEPPKANLPKAGVLADLRSGAPRHE